MKWGKSEKHYSIWLVTVLGLIVLGLLFFVPSSRCTFGPTFSMGAYIVEDHLVLDYCWAKSQTGYEVVFTSTIPSGIVIPGSDCNGTGCVVYNQLAGASEINCLILHGPKPAPGSYVFVTEFTELNSGYSGTITTTLGIDPPLQIYLPLLSR